ncbi:dehydrodolichyl diphosphate synthase 2 [Vitis riparia]|uniref:dehydrodolichyl diphosphate synthase 2 n=1 Tax=Vitis riparia TaxID=96939 RepID=UPI00155A41F6|nr:dehydrodolichyl diphosphate synthase 2 [Vitis riparia]
MLSFRFPISADNARHILKSKHSSCTFRSNRIDSFSFPPIPVPRFHKLRTAKTDVVGEEEAREVNERAEEFPDGLLRELMPEHVAVIMDGNVRWAQKRGLPAASGHQAGVRSLRELVELCCKWGIKVLSVFAFSYDNWSRSEGEVGFLMSLIERVVKAELPTFGREGIRVSVIGDVSKLPEQLQKLIIDVEETTKENSRLQFIVALSYSGQRDILQACKNIGHKVKDGLIEPEDINKSLIEQELQTNCTEFPFPDLLIRTSGELRVSNFMLWQIAYTELCFFSTLWPDFGKDEFVEALRSFQKRQRRYGGRN